MTAPDADTRWKIVLPIIQYQLDADNPTEINESKLLELAEAQKDLIKGGNEQIFIDAVVKDYEDFLASN
tara:strand:+ start:2030 stop:2236 length:207 start_codon:yes stop_codon:yes gene_type:complete